MDSGPVAIPGTIGTWAAVLIALLALVAVLGPILIWAASRTERNKALHAAGDANQPFIGSGFHFVGFDVRIFRRVKAPIIGKVPDNFALQFDPGRYTETKSMTTWVQFANLLRGYGATFPGAITCASTVGGQFSLPIGSGYWPSGSQGDIRQNLHKSADVSPCP